MNRRKSHLTEYHIPSVPPVPTAMHVLCLSIRESLAYTRLPLFSNATLAMEVSVKRLFLTISTSSGYRAGHTMLPIPSGSYFCSDNQSYPNLPTGVNVQPLLYKRKMSLHILLCHKLPGIYKKPLSGQSSI